MINNSQERMSKIDILLLVYNFYLRFLALVCLILGAVYWLRLVGVFSGTLWRFDLMPWQWQFLSTTLAVVYPVALIGLWMYSPWGIVLWYTTVLIEVITTFCSDVVYQPVMPIFHGILFLVLIALQILVVFSKRCYTVNATES
ncbi:DUF6163 family protein [Bartonella sp. CB178]|uniref:DUF6163 family protein n=1 Tax=Bartonella sp. CB178 TaxID=3112255 RepID=UPI00300DC2AA